MFHGPFFKGGASASCVIVRFSAITFAVVDNRVEIRAYLDNGPAALPAAVMYSDGSGGAGAHSFEFIFPSVAPGFHVVRMQYRSPNGGLISVSRHTTVVQFAP